MKNIKSYLSFRIGKEYFAASVDHVHNIIEFCPITRIPDVPEYLLGIINLRGSGATGSRFTTKTGTAYK